MNMAPDLIFIFEKYFIIFFKYNLNAPICLAAGFHSNLTPYYEFHVNNILTFVIIVYYMYRMVYNNMEIGKGVIEKCYLLIYCY